MNDEALFILIHGHSGVGKSSLAVTAPYPRLYLDVEAASRFLPIVRKMWDPFTEPIPVADGTWDTVVVPTRDFATMLKVYERLNTEDHQFASLIIDSISELQVKLKEQVAGRDQLKTQDWGNMLTVFSGLIRDIRDLTTHPTHPLRTVVLTAMSKDYDGMLKPYLQGQLASQMTYWPDIVGYMFVQEVPDENPANPPYEVRRLLTRKHPEYEAKERVQGRLPKYVDYPNIEAMLNAVFPPVAAPAAPVAVEAPVETNDNQIKESE